MNYNFDHDEWHNSTRALKEHLWSRNGPSHWRSPVSFGPMPSPRQDHHGLSIPSPNARFTTYSIRFRSSATYLKTLFPTPAFTFARPGTVAEASFQCTELRNMPWLGGGGYKYLGLWIHGVQYTKKDGGKVVGSLLVVLLESLADPIITGREELGMPKIFCDIEIGSATTEATSIQCSWRGAPFLRMHLDGLGDVRGDQQQPEQHVANGGRDEAETRPLAAAVDVDVGTMFYRYVPAVGKSGEADAAYAVLVRNHDESSAVARRVERACHSQSSRLEFMEGDWDSLPTLHHIAAAFAEIPVYGIIEGKMEEGRGVDDISHAERIE
jgi:hypothetical protein